MSVYAAYRTPRILVRVNGKRAPLIESRAASLKFTETIGKRDHGELVLIDDRGLVNDSDLLKPDDVYTIVFGLDGNMSRPKEFRLKTWDTNFDSSISSVKLQLVVTTGRRHRKPGRVRKVSEPSRTQKPRVWGRVQTSEIAKEIAKRHGLTPRVVDSGDLDLIDYVQTGNVSDYEYLQQLARDLHFECFIEGDSLYYRPTPYDEPPRFTFHSAPRENRGVDTVLISFRPKVKVAKVSVSARGSGNSQKGAKTTQTKPKANAAVSSAASSEQTLAQSIFSASASDLEAATSQVLAATENFGKNKGTSSAEAVQNGLKIVSSSLADLKQIEKALARTKRTTGALAHKEKGRDMHDTAQGDGTGRKSPCKRAKPSGTTPTGDDSSDTEKKVSTVRRQVTLGDDRKTKLVAKSNESSVQANESKPALRKCRAAAVHTRYKDRAVTATAELIGDPRFRSRVSYLFENVGRRTSGKWYAKQVVHSIGSDYIIRMQLKRGTLRRSRGKRSKKPAPNEKKPAAVVNQVRVTATLGDKRDKTLTVTEVPAK